jgi:hypothetical protein
MNKLEAKILAVCKGSDSSDVVHSLGNALARVLTRYAKKSGKSDKQLHLALSALFTARAEMAEIFK